MFKRKVSFVVWQLLKFEYAKNINEKNINSLSSWKIHQIFKDEDPNLKEIYLHNTISSWAENTIFVSEQEKLREVRKIIRKTSIKLNNVEKQQLFLLEERSFAIERNIKRIDVNFTTRKKEHIGAKYINVDLFYLRRSQKLKLINYKKELLISNKRFIFNENQTFNFNQIQAFVFSNQGFQFQYADKKNYVLRLYDNPTLNNTILNIFKKRKKILEKQKDSLYL